MEAIATCGWLALVGQRARADYKMDTLTRSKLDVYCMGSPQWSPQEFIHDLKASYRVCELTLREGEEKGLEFWFVTVAFLYMLIICLIEWQSL